MIKTRENLGAVYIYIYISRPLEKNNIINIDKKIAVET